MRFTGEMIQKGVLYGYMHRTGSSEHLCNLAVSNDFLYSLCCTCDSCRYFICKSGNVSAGA